MNLWYVLETAAAIFPDRAAVTDDTRSMTYRELRGEAMGWAQLFLDVKPPGPVAFVGTNGVDAVSVLFGAMLANRAFLPLNYRSSGQDFVRLIKASKPSIVVAESRYSEIIDKSQAEHLFCPILVDSGPRARISRDLEPTNSEENAVLLFTSGTTSAPKLVTLTHSGFSSYVLNTAVAGSAGQNETALMAAPAYHVAGVANILTSVYRCRHLVLLRQFDAVNWLDTVGRVEATHAMVVPTMLARILKATESGKPVPPSLRFLSYGGAPASRDLVERAARTFGESVDLINAFGLTETSSTICVLSGSDHRAALAEHATVHERARLGSIGRPVPGIEIRIVLEDGSAAGPGQEGELRVRGAQMASGYTTSALRLDDDGWLMTGDAAMFDDAGYVFVLGRMDDMIIRGGENISPVEIENHLLALPEIFDAVVFGVPNEEWGQVVAALVVWAGQEVDFTEIKLKLRHALPGFKVPEIWMAVDEIPRNDIGKPLRREAVRMV